MRKAVHFTPMEVVMHWNDILALDVSNRDAGSVEFMFPDEPPERFRGRIRRIFVERENLVIELRWGAHHNPETDRWEFDPGVNRFEINLKYQSPVFTADGHIELEMPSLGIITIYGHNETLDSNKVKGLL